MDTAECRAGVRSPHHPHLGSLAQWLEQHSYKMEAAGSIPARPTTRNATVLRVFICHIPVFRYY